MLTRKQIFTIFILCITIIFIYIIKPPYHVIESFSNNDLKIYFINLDSNIDRWQNIQKHNLPNLHRFPAINGKLLNKDSLIKQNVVNPSNKLRPGQLGCALSHIEVLKLSQLQPEKYSLILEDDVIIPKNLPQTLYNLQLHFPKKWDIIFLGGCNIHGKKYNEKFIIPTNNDGSRNLCLHAYLVNKQNIKKILDILKPLHRPVDSQLREKFNQLKVFYLYPNLINQNKELISNRRVLDGLPQSNYWKEHHKDITIIY